MPEKIIPNFFSPVSERLRSPLLSAILIAWLAWNWKIIYVTLFLSYETGSTQKYDKILELTNWCNGLIFPVLSGILYTIIIPLVENYAYWWIEKQKNKRRDAKVELLKLRKQIAPSELIEKLDQLKEARDKIGEISAEKNELSLKNKELNMSITELNKELGDTKNDIKAFEDTIKEKNKEIKTINDRTKPELFFVGEWKLIWKEIKSPSNNGEEYFSVKDGKFLLEQGSYDIIQFESDKQQRYVRFYKIIPRNGGKLTYAKNNLKIMDNGHLRGEEEYNSGEKYEVNYKKVDFGF